MSGKGRALRYVPSLTVVFVHAQPQAPEAAKDGVCERNWQVLLGRRRTLGPLRAKAFRAVNPNLNAR